MTTVPKWQSGHHAVLCALKATYDNFTAATTASAWADAFRLAPANMPTVPTAFGGQYNAIPTNGSFYLRPTRSVDTSHPLPFVEFFQDSANATLQEDGASAYYEIRIGCRVGIGAITTGGSTGGAILDSQAEALCRMVCVLAADYMRAAGLALDPGNAFGICYAFTDQNAEVDLTTAKPPTANGAAAIIATGYVKAVQRQFNPAGLGGSL